MTKDSPISRWAWVPIPILLLAMIALRVADFRATADNPAVAFSLHLVFMLCTSLWIAHLTSSSFLASGTPGLLFLLCGATTLGLAGVTGFGVAPSNPNENITIHNTLVWVAAIFHLLGVVLTFKRSSALKHREWWLLAGLSISCGMVATVALASARGSLPAFFTQGQGGTPIRYFVLASAVAMFTCSGATLLVSKRFTPRTFSRWYGFGLLLVALGLLSVMIQFALGDALGWLGRVAQWLGGVYLLLAAITVARQSSGQNISLAATRSDPRLGYALAMAFVVASTLGRLIFMHDMGKHALTASFYPAVILAALLGGRGPGILASVLSATSMEYFWIKPNQDIHISDPKDLITLFFFLAGCALVVFITSAVQRERARAEAAEQVRATEERLSLALKAGAMGAYDLNLLTDALWWSPEVYSIFGLSPDSFTPTRDRFTAILHPDDREKVWTHITEAIQQRQASIQEFRIIRPDGALRWIANRAQTEFCDDKPVRHYGVAVDITDRKIAEEKLRDAHRQLGDRAVQLEELVRERTAKLHEMIEELQHVSYAITHDMRAPLRAMSGFASILLESNSTQADPEAVDYAKRIVNASNRLDKLIQESLQYTKTVLAEKPLEPVDLSALVLDLLTTYPNLHPDKADICIANQLPVVIGTEALLTQCFSNLLGNAVKFVPHGKRPQIRVRTELHGDTAKIWIEDNGIGIPREAQHRLFKMFERVTSDYEGSGIGLAVVRKVVERMGGQVGVESEPNKGSRFWLILKLAR